MRINGFLLAASDQSWLDKAGSMISDAVGGVSDAIGNAVGGVFDALWEKIYWVIYQLEMAVCYFIEALYKMFEIFSGKSKVIYNGEGTSLMDVFFQHSTINHVYMGMTIIGVSLCFAFTIAAVIKKMFDVEDKMRQSLGGILGNALKSIITIFLISAIVMGTLNASNILLQYVSELFDTAETKDIKSEITFTDDDFATMARVLDTIGNYSLNESYDSRYNINSCFNAIRPDMQRLQNNHVFDIYYNSVDSYGRQIETWQSLLQKIANAQDLSTDVTMDRTYPALTTAIVSAMKELHNNYNLQALDHAGNSFNTVGQDSRMDRLLFLMGTMEAAKNSEYNRNPSLTDALRGPYYSGEKSVYDYDSVKQDFNLAPSAMSYVMVFIVAYLMFKNLLVIIMNCIARIFGLLVLYLIAPPIVAVQPLDDGEKFREWIKAFVVQTFSVFATVIGMRILMLFVPIVMSSKLVLFENSPILNMLAKALLIWGGMEAANRATGMFTGILTQQAGFQAVQAGDMSRSAGALGAGISSVGSGALSGAIGAAKAGWGVAKGAAKLGGQAVGALAGAGWSGMKGLANSAYRVGEKASDKIAQSKGNKRLNIDNLEYADAKSSGGGKGGAAGGKGDAASQKNMSGTGKTTGAGGKGGAKGNPPGAGKKFSAEDLAKIFGSDPKQGADNGNLPKNESDTGKTDDDFVSGSINDVGDEGQEPDIPKNESNVGKAEDDDFVSGSINDVGDEEQEPDIPKNESNVGKAEDDDFVSGSINDVGDEGQEPDIPLKSAPPKREASTGRKFSQEQLDGIFGKAKSEPKPEPPKNESKTGVSQPEVPKNESKTGSSQQSETQQKPSQPIQLGRIKPKPGTKPKGGIKLPNSPMYRGLRRYMHNAGSSSDSANKTSTKSSIPTPPPLNNPLPNNEKKK